MSVLIVEDDTVARRIIETVLRRSRYETLSATNGREALELLDRMPGIRVVVTDLMMPEMDGFDLLERLQARRRGDLGLVVCSMLADNPRIQRAAMKYGCWGFLSKPIDAPALLDAVRGALHYRQRKQVVMRRRRQRDLLGAA